MDTAPLKKAEQEVDPRVDLAIQRTELALDRTQLAWVRTVISLIGAGIALDKGLELLHETRLIEGQALTKSAHGLGLVLGGASSAIFAAVTWEYWRAMRRLVCLDGRRYALFRPVLLISLFTILLGVGLFALLIESPG